jgi:hypothetical protein
MKTFQYVVFHNGQEIGRGSISLLKGSHYERISRVVSKTYGPHKLGFTWTIL